MPFEDIVGHVREIGLLKKAMLSGRVAHAYLFAGAEGIGKRRVALSFAKALNCTALQGDYCGTCQACLSIDGGNNLNYTVIAPTDGLIKIEAVRDVQAALRYRATAGKKVVIVDSAEKLKIEAANAFLKTLEEPPADTVIILVTSSPSALLPTILSRCQRVNFSPLPAGLIAGILRDEQGLGEDNALSIARLSGGSITRARSYIDAGFDKKRGEILLRLASLTAADPEGAIKFAEELAKKDDLLDCLEIIKTFFRDRSVHGEGAPALTVNADMALYAATGNGTDPVECFSIVEKARRDIMPPRYANKQLTLEMMLMRVIGCTV